MYGADYGKELQILSYRDETMDLPSYSLLDNPLSNAEENCPKTLVDDESTDPEGNQVDTESLMDYSVENPMTSPGDNPRDSSMDNPVGFPIVIAMDNLLNESGKHSIYDLVDNRADNSLDNPMGNHSQSEIALGIPLENPINPSVDSHVESEDVDMLIESKLKRCNLKREYSPGHSVHEPFKCPHCDRCFRTKGYLKLHKEVHSGDRPFKCSKCKKTFRLQSHLLQHIPIQSEILPFECTRCDKIFHLKRHFQEDTLMHSGRKPFHCSECKKTFRLKSHLKQHKMTHSENK